MTKTYAFAALGVAAALGLGAAPLFAADAVPLSIKAALANPGRPPLEIERDGAMKPADVLAFTGIRPGMQVAEIMPDAGYFTRILSGAVGAKGRVYAVVPQPEGNLANKRGPIVKDPSENLPLSRVELAYQIEDQPEFENVDVYWEGLQQNGGLFAVPAQLDVVFTAGGYHVLKGKENAKLDMLGVNKAIFRAMKPGGVYVVIDNAAKAGAGFTAADSLGRSDAEAVKADIVAAGFVPDGESKVLVQSSDDRSKPTDGTEPTDMFVLRFKKPANAPDAKRPPMSVMAGYFGNTRHSNVGATGNVTGKRERRVFYHADMTFQEFGNKGTGNNPFQSGRWFFNADGEPCMIKTYPFEDRAQVNCQEKDFNHKPGDTWISDDGRPDSITKGYEYFGK